jgi:protein-disulfide isomerase
MKQSLPFIIIGSVLVLAIAAGAFFYSSSKPPAQSSGQTTMTPDPATSGASMSRGIVLVEEYGDYQCPPCGALHPEMNKVKAEFGDRIRFVFYQLPLITIHPNANDAARAAIAARLQGKFWEMHDMLYSTQKEWAELPTVRPMAAGFAGQLGLNVDRFVKDLDSPQVIAAVADDVRRAESFGVNSTPTLFIAGRRVEDADMTPEKIRSLIRAQLGGS